MKRRLSDHDEWVFDRLARLCPRPQPKSRKGYERTQLMKVYVRDGWAAASDSCTAAVLPVEADWNGAVSAHDALLGGAVEVDAGPSWDLVQQLGGMVKPHHGQDLVVPLSAVDALRGWEGREAETTSGGATASRTCIAIGHRFDVEVHPDHATEQWAANLRTSYPSGGVSIAPCVVQLPYLAKVVTLISDAADGAAVLVGPEQMQPIVVHAAPVDGEREGEHGWGLVMPIRTNWSVAWDHS